MISLMYHDVVGDSIPPSGFSGADADLYKLSLANLDRQLAAFRTHGLVVGLSSAEIGAPSSVVLTFDDGGTSAAAAIAPRLREFGWTACFFVVAGLVGRPRFVTGTEVKALSEQGHVIGSHSLTHPLQMGRCSRQQIRREWRESKERLEGLTGRVVDVASVPGGYLTRAVAEEAASAGFRILFTSEPTQGVRQVEGCQLVGRFAVRRSTPSWIVTAAARGDRLPWLLQRVAWSLRKVAKRAAGPAYLRYRQYLLSANDSDGTETTP